MVCFENLTLNLYVRLIWRSYRVISEFPQSAQADGNARNDQASLPFDDRGDVKASKEIWAKRPFDVRSLFCFPRVNIHDKMWVGSYGLGSHSTTD